MGHVNYGPFLVDPKGILGNVTINDVVISNWQIRPLNMTHILGYQPHHFKGLSSGVDTPNAPTFFTGKIPPSSDGIPKDTFLRLKNWNKVSWYSMVVSMFVYVLRSPKMYIQLGVNGYKNLSAIECRCTLKPFCNCVSGSSVYQRF